MKNALILLAGGIGKRFKENKYKYPKSLINVLGYPILFYLLENLLVVLFFQILD